MPVTKEEIQRNDATKVLGLGKVAGSMSHSTNNRNNRGRMHQEVTSKQATEILIRQLIHQHCRCYVTGLPLAVYGQGVGSPWDSYRYSPDRLDNSKGYEADNVRLTTVFVNIATSHCKDEYANYTVKRLLAAGAKFDNYPLEERPYNFHLLYQSPELWTPWEQFDYSLVGLRQRTKRDIYEWMRAIALEAFETRPHLPRFLFPNITK